MASVREYTTAAIVRAQLGEQVHGSFTDTEIDTIISMNEGYIDAILQIGTGGNADFTFSASNAKHLILRKWATALSAADLLMTSSTSFRTIDEAKLAAELAIYMAEECQKYLSGEKDSIKDWVGE